MTELDVRYLRANQAQRGKAILLVLHGLGDTREGWQWLPEALAIADLDYLMINAPDPYGDGLAWYDLDQNTGLGIARSRRLLNQLIAQLLKDGWEEGQIGMLGFSQGCLMSLETGLKGAVALGVIVGISGYLHEPQEFLTQLSPVSRKIPVLMTHGSRDPLLPMVEVRRQAETLRTAGVAMTWQEYSKAHTVDFVREIPAIRDFLQKRWIVMGSLPVANQV